MLWNSVTSWKAFSASAACGSVFPANSCCDGWRRGSRWARGVRWAQWTRQNLTTRCAGWLCHVLSHVVVGENWALSGGQCWLQVLEFSMRLFDLLSILLRYDRFTAIQKVVVDQTGSGPPNSDHDLFLVKCGFGKCFGAPSQSNHWAGGHWLSPKIHFSLHITIW